MPVYLPGLTFGTGYGGASYAHSPYGGVSYATRTPVPVSDGFGGYSYSYSSYGSTGIRIPKVASAISLSGFTIKVFFSEEMSVNSELTDPANYNITETFGIPVTATSVAVSDMGTSGAVSVSITHTGSTLGGQYKITVSNLSSIEDVVMVSPHNEVTIYALGDTTTYSITYSQNNTYRLIFRNSLGNPQEVLTEAEFSPGVSDPSSYSISTDYPIVPPISNIVHDVTNKSHVTVDLAYTTSTNYDFTVGPATALNYTGIVLPEDDTNFTGAQIGVGSGYVSNALYLTKTIGDRFGYSFSDTTGKVLPNSTFNAEIYIDATTGSYSSLSDETFATYYVSDGSVEVSVILRDISGIKVLEVVSGAYSAQINFDWYSQPFKLGLVRNQKGDFYTLVCNDYPELTFNTASATGAPTIPAGSAFVISPNIATNLFKIESVKFTSSQTVFTTHWNFIHSAVTSFVGTAVSTRNVIRTKRGPLVRGWGDNTAAKKEDVTVKVEGVVVEVAKINPYIGEIYPAIPIPLSSPGTFSVTVDYIWFQNPSLPMLGLNTQGLTLNTWDRVDGHTDYPKPEKEIPTGPYGKAPYKERYGGASYPPLEDLFKKRKGVTKTNRFPLGITLGPGERKSPKKIGHRYIGFQNDYSALLNNSGLLLLNKNPHSISEGVITASTLYQKGSFDGTKTPPEQGWNLSGLDSGAVVGDGTYRLVDNSSGSYSLGFESIYSRELDLSLDSFVTGISRFKVESYTADGVFTGIGFGLYDGHKLGLIGALIINGVQHFGLLLDGDNPHLERSWKLGFEFSATALSQTVITVPYNLFPNGVESGDRFRIVVGAQAGTYTIEECGLNLNDENLVEITLTSALPGNISIPGNEKFQIFFETKWDTNLCSFRIISEFTKGTIEVYLGSEISGLFLPTQDLTPYPAQTALLIPAEEKGSFFWGSISRKALNRSIWDIVQYLLSPVEILNTVTGIYDSLDMNSLPNSAGNTWYVSSGFGESSVSSGVLSLRSNSSSTDKDTSYAFEKVEPFLTPKIETDVEAKFQVLSGNSLGDAEICIKNTNRKVLLKTLRYLDIAPRKLISEIPTCSLSGLLSPELEGWVLLNPTKVETSVTGQILTIIKGSNEVAEWEQVSTHFGLSPEGCILEWDVKLSDAVSGSRGVGFTLDVSTPLPFEKLFTIVYDTGMIRIESENGTTVYQTFLFDWDDSNFHQYKLTADPISDNITLMVDGVLLGSWLWSSLVEVGSNFHSTIRMIGNGSCTVELNALSMIALRSDPNEKRTLGVLLRGGDPTSIDGYRIPRSDSGTSKNSSSSALIVEMDFTSMLEVRLFSDPLWGVSVFRPDINFPDGSPYVPGNTSPLNAWINVESRDLPVLVQNRGSISFGSSEPYSVSSQVWDYFRYRVRKPPNGYGIAPQGMVLNKSEKFASGEYLFDKTLEDKTFKSRTSTLIYLPDCAIYADRVFQLFVDGVLQPSSSYSFDKFTQYITLTNALPSEKYSVRVVFAVGKPITKNYLCSEPIDNSVTLLNEGTPPIPKSRDDIGGHYSDVQYCEVEQGDSVTLSSLCDGPGPGKGLAEIEIDGHFTRDAHSVPHGPGGVFGKSSPTYKGASSSHYLPVFHASGGSYTGPTLSPGSMMLYPNQQKPQGNKGMGINQTSTIRLESVTPYSDTYGTFDDNTPPAFAEPVEENPDGVPATFGNGACAYLIEDFGLDVSRLGRWGGITSLTNSMLSGGSQLNGTQFVLQGGSQIERPTETSGKFEAVS